MAKQFQDMQKLQKTLEAIASHVRAVNLPAEVWYADRLPDFAGTDWAKKTSAPFADGLRRFAADERWGGYDTDAWFRACFTVPDEFAGRDVWMEVRTGREGKWNAVNPQFLAFIDGVEAQGLDTAHTSFLIAKNAAAGNTYIIDFDAWSGAVPEWHQARAVSGDDNGPAFFFASFYTTDSQMQKLYYDFKVPYDVAVLIGGSEEALVIQKHLRCAADILDLRETGSEKFYESVKICSRYLEENFYGAVCSANSNKPTAWCVGHTHIDVAWLWRYRHTMRKAERSFSTALALMDGYPEYVFMSSQPQLYQYVKERRPAVYERIKEKIKEGRWDPEGGMWVEADCNVPSGEALIRQFVHGKRFFMDEFGADAKLLWLPDVFGYSAALPQICKKCGVDYFMTTKINWNEVNQFPADSFYWKGVDGTRMLTHFIPNRDYVGPNRFEGWQYFFTSYNGQMTPREIMGGWERYQQKDVSRDYMVAYGHGDGGGGTTADMIEQMRRMSRGIPGCPVTKPAKTLEYFKHLEETAGDDPRLPEWSGELYLEFHRGTYTTIAKNKRNNRKSENALLNLEALGVMASLADGAYKYPSRTLDKHWKTVLLNQFHDVLPGSSIKEVYDDTDAMYAEIFSDAQLKTSQCENILAFAAKRSGDSLVVINTLGHERSGYCAAIKPDGFTEGVSLFDESGEEYPLQTTWDGKIIFYVKNVPGMGCKVMTFGKSTKTFSDVEADVNHFANEKISAAFDEKGRIVSLYDKRERRELAKPGCPMNALETYEDRPGAHDAWDIAPYYVEKRYEADDMISREIIEKGPVRAVLLHVYKYLASEIRQNVCFYADSARIDFCTEADWRNEHIMLKAAFPADLLADKATFEIQYGAIERPTHFNTSWEHAKFETCAQKWADLSECNGGLSLLNDCKYGHDIHGDTLRLTLLRSATSPCVGADRGRHEFTYSIYPHAGGWREGGTVREAYDLNRPLAAVFAGGANGDGAPVVSLAESSALNVNMEVLKKADDGSGFIIRLYEAHGGRTNASVKISLPATRAYECDMLENNLSEADFVDGSLNFVIKPYEIKTFKLV